MNHQRLLTAGGLVLLALAATLTPVHAQEKIAIPLAEYENLKRKAADADRLREELDQLRKELTRLKQANSNVAPPPARPTATTAAPATTSPKPATNATAPAVTTSATTVPSPTAPAPTPVPAPAALPPAKAGETVDATDLIQHFAQNPTESAQRYGDQPVKLRGVVAAFDKPVMRRDFEIILRSGLGQMTCRVAPPQRYSAVFTTQAGSVLTGRTDRGAEMALLKVGDVVEIEGNCQGFKDGAVTVTRCKVTGLK